MSEEKVSFFEELERIPCFRKSFTYGISSGIVIGLASFMFTSRIKRSTDLAVLSFGATTLSFWFYCRYHWTKEHFLAKKMNSSLHEVMLKEGRTNPSEPPEVKFT